MSDDRGAGTVLVLLLAVALLVVAVGSAMVVRVFVLHAEVSAAADLAALAAARSTDCDEGRRVAQANGSQLLSCAADGSDYQVTVGTELTVLGQSVPVRAIARAGY